MVSVGSLGTLREVISRGVDTWQGDIGGGWG